MSTNLTLLGTEAHYGFSCVVDPTCANVLGSGKLGQHSTLGQPPANRVAGDRPALGFAVPNYLLFLLLLTLVAYALARWGGWLWREALGLIIVGALCVVTANALWFYEIYEAWSPASRAVQAVVMLAFAGVTTFSALALWLAVRLGRKGHTRHER